MVIRVDTTNLARGLDFSVVIQTDTEPTISLYAFNTTTHTVETLENQVVKDGVFFKSLSKAPYFDGFLLATINSKSIVVKKIGHPTPHFVIGYKEDYTIPYKLYNMSGIEFSSGDLINIIDGFYYCEMRSDVTVMETLKKRFIIKENFTKLEFEVDLGDSVLSEQILPDYELNTTLSDVTLSDVVLDDITLDSTLPNVEIRG